MITKKDAQFLRDYFKETFVTKNDLSSSLDPLKKDIAEVKKVVYQVKRDLKDVKIKLNELTDFVVPTLGNIFEWTDDIHKAFIGKSSRKRLS